MLATTVAASSVLRRPRFLEGVRPVIAFRIVALVVSLCVTCRLGSVAFGKEGAPRFGSVDSAVLADLQLGVDRTSRMAVSVGARRPVADVSAIFTSRSVPTFSPMRRITC
eukprot:6206698-Pleurochrysis_carterae.AAC.2